MEYKCRKQVIMGRKYYDDAFKSKCLKLLLVDRLSLREAERITKVSAPTLHKWKKEYEAGSLVKAKLDKEHKEDLINVRKLKDRIEELEKENKLLKKVQAFSSQQID